MSLGIPWYTVLCLLVDCLQKEIALLSVSGGSWYAEELNFLSMLHRISSATFHAAIFRTCTAAFGVGHFPIFFGDCFFETIGIFFHFDNMFNRGNRIIWHNIILMRALIFFG